LTNFPAKGEFSNSSTIGLLLINLGTPKSTQLKDIKSYLKEFLNDPYVIDIPTPLRWLLVNGIILNTRPPKTQHAYQSIWTERGSPLLTLSQDFKSAFAKLAQENGFHGPIELGMRYAEPSLKVAIENLRNKGATQILAFPLYPQYALSSTETAKSKVHDVLVELGAATLPVKWVSPFFNDPDYIHALTESVHMSGALSRTDHLLMSFHGLPERHVKKTDGAGGNYCLSKSTCCDSISDLNRNCYRAQSYQTARSLAQALALKESQWSVGFQSRLTRRWIQPFTDHRLKELPSQGIKRLAVICPSFTVDCLETLEEIGMRAKEEFRSAGGTHLELIPCVNAQPAWVKSAYKIAVQSLNLNQRDFVPNV
jgi:ferrochelatase